MLTLTENLFAAASFMPHGICYLWKPGLVGLHLVSNAIIALSYFSIPLTLVHIVRRRSDLPFDWIFFLFAAFIISCGIGHGMDIWTLWHPDYWLSGYIRAMTALVSLITAIALVYLIPKILTLPSRAQIEQTNRQLSQEIRERQQVEAQLQQEQQFLHALLENLSDGIVACDQEGILTLFNRATQEFHGLPQEAIPAAEWVQHYDLYLADGKTPMSKEQIPLFRALEGESVRDVEMAIVSKRAKPRILLASGEPIVTPEGKKLGAVVVMRDISERKQAEAALRESEQCFSGAFEYAAIGMALVAPDGRWLKVNRSLCDIVGYSESELLATTFQAITHPDDLEADLDYVRKMLAGEIRTYQMEKRYFHKLGHVVWILLNVSLVRDAQDQPLYFIAQIQDISDRKQVEAKIQRLNQELEERVTQRTAQLEAANRLKDDLLIRERQAKAAIEIYEDLVNNLPIGLSIWHLEDGGDTSSFRLVEINPAAAQILKLNRESDLGKPMRDCLPSVLGPANQIVVEAYAEVVRSEEIKNFSEVRCGDSPLREQIFAVTAFPLPEQCAGIAFENITERKKTEKALVESTRRYRLVVNSVKEVIFQTDIEGCWTFLNRAWTEITGFEIIESLKRPFTDYIFSQSERQHCAKMFQSLIAGEQKSFQGAFRSQTKAGDCRWLEMNAQLNRDDRGEILGSSGTIRDVTERQQAEAVLQARAEELAQLNRLLLTTTAQLEKRNQELDQFAYVASHDLKAPLRAIANLSEWLEEDLEDKLDEDTSKQMNLLRGRVHRMENLINGLLQYSRVGRIKVESETVDVGQLLAEVIDSLAPPTQLAIEVKGDMPTLVTERLPLQQVFSNLIGNAIKHHNRPEGKVTISVQDWGKFSEFAVADDGPGIAPEYHEKVFVIFQTLEARDKTENTGIGLSIVKKAVENQGGTIWLDSQVGKGTTFHFTWRK